jgi:hypothetical protein
MSVNESIDGLVTDAGVTVRRSTPVPPVDGIAQPSTPSTLTIDAVIQPAYNLNRVVGGADLHALVDGQSVTDVRQLHTRTKLYARVPATDPAGAKDPDVVVGYQNANWTVIRVEEWNLDGEIHYHCVIAKQTLGAS